MHQPAPEQAVPRRALIVDDDQRIRESLADLLRAADVEAVPAADGEEALTLLGRQWFPVVITNRSTPVIDGFEFVSRLRAVAVAPVYVVMVTSSSEHLEHERGYCAGVDYYLPKKDYERELPGKVMAGIAAIRRRLVSGTSRGDGPVTVDLESGAHTARHLIGRLHAELAFAAHAAKALQLLSVCIQSANDRGDLSTVSDALLQAVHETVRPKLDWVARLPASRNACRLVIVMPEAGAHDAARVEHNVRNTFAGSLGDGALQLTAGVAQLELGARKPSALELLSEAESQRRSGQRAPRVDIKNVQGAGAEQSAHEAAA